MKPVETRVAIRQLILFTLLVNGLAWLGPLLGGDPTAPGLGVLVWGTAPFVATLVMKFVVRDKTALGLNLALRGNGRWYALSALIYPLAIALVLGVGLLIGATTIHNVTIPTLLTAMMPLAVTYFIFAFFEEVGWRGYLTPKVAGINNGLFGYVVIGVIWASWHFPYLRELWAHTSEGLVTLLPRFIVGTIVSAIVYGEIRKRSGAVWPAVLMHWLGNTIANTLLIGAASGSVPGAGYVAFTPGRAWLGSFGVEGVLMMVIFALIGGVLYRTRRGCSVELPS